MTNGGGELEHMCWRQGYCFPYLDRKILRYHNPSYQTKIIMTLARTLNFLVFLSYVRAPYDLRKLLRST